MILTNLLLAVLIGFKIMEFISVRIDKQQGVILSKKDKEAPPIVKEDKALRETISGLLEEMSISAREINKLRDELLAHKVFTTKTFGELTTTPSVSSKKKKNKTYQKLAQSIRKPKGLKFSHFQIDKEIFRHLQKRGLLKVLNIKYIKDIKSQCDEKSGITLSYAKEKQKAYQRLWARQNYELKK